MTNMQFLVDESVGKKFSEIMKNFGKEVLFVGDSIHEVDDKKVLSFANRHNLILITKTKILANLFLGLANTQQELYYSELP